MGKIDVLAKNLGRDHSSKNRDRGLAIEKAKSIRKELLSLAQKRPSKSTREQLKRIGENLDNLGKEMASYYRSENDKRNEEVNTNGYKERLEERRQRERSVSQWWDKQQLDFAEAEKVLKESVLDPAELKKEINFLREFKDRMEVSLSRDMSR